MKVHILDEFLLHVSVPSSRRTKCQFLTKQMPCEADVHAFYFVQQLRRKQRHDAEGTAVRVLKTYVVTPWLKTRDSYCRIAQNLFMVVP